MTYRQLFNLFRSKLSSLTDPNEVSSLFFIAVEHYANLSRTLFYLQENDDVPDTVQQNMENVVLRLMKNEPIQYILEEAWFCNHKFFVNQNVLIPRSETEELVSLILQKRPQAKRIVDLGTGSGCIAISLQLALKTHALGIDISEKALDVARQNARKLKSNTEFQIADIHAGQIEHAGKFDVVVSNPPYVKNLEKTKMLENVTRFEPAKALYVPDDDPLLYYRSIINVAGEHLNFGGLLAVEINEAHGQETAQLFKSNFYKVDIHKDIHGKDRFVTAEKWKTKTN